MTGGDDLGCCFTAAFEKIEQQVTEGGDRTGKLKQSFYPSSATSVNTNALQRAVPSVWPRFELADGVREDDGSCWREGDVPRF